MRRPLAAILALVLTMAACSGAEEKAATPAATAADGDMEPSETDDAGAATTTPPAAAADSGDSSGASEPDAADEEPVATADTAAPSGASEPDAADEEPAATTDTAAPAGVAEPDAGGEEPVTTTTPAGLMMPDTTVVTVSGFLIDEGFGLRLCETLAESYPPQCGDNGIVLDNRNGAGIGTLVVAEGVVWSDDYLTVTGTQLESGTIVIDSITPFVPASVDSGDASAAATDEDAGAQDTEPDGSGDTAATANTAGPSGASEPDAGVGVPTTATTMASGDDAVAGPFVTLSGFLFDDGSGLRVCGTLAESYPPRCGDSGVFLDNRNGVGVGALYVAEGVVWSEDYLAVSGILTGNGILVIESITSASS